MIGLTSEITDEVIDNCTNCNVIVIVLSGRNVSG